jgi:two-component system sensor histidine kinase BaeS
MVRLVVEDTGVGIPPDELPHVFDRFWRGLAAMGMTGSGIGLAVVAGLVQAHGGKVEATSSGGKGARFVVALPGS